MTAAKLMAAALKAELCERVNVVLTLDECEAIMAAVIERAGKTAERSNEERQRSS